MKLQIEISQKLSAFLGPGNSLPAIEESAYRWHGDLLTLEGKRSILLVNEALDVPILLYDVQDKNLSALLPDALERTYEFLETSMTQPSVFMSHLHPLYITATTGDWPALSFFSELALENTDCLCPSTVFQEEFLYLAIVEQVNFQNAQKGLRLQTRLNFSMVTVSRELLVPVDLTFRTLHKILQDAYHWKNRYAHTFLLPDTERGAILLSDNREILSMAGESVLTGTEDLVLNAIPGSSVIQYGYHPEVSIQVLCNLSEADCAIQIPYCEDGEGDAPPEATGGELGYMDFLRVLHTPLDPHHERTRKWAQSQDYASFDIGKVNATLKAHFPMY
jgi:hypothetical protein